MPRKQRPVRNRTAMVCQQYADAGGVRLYGHPHHGCGRGSGSSRIQGIGSGFVALAFIQGTGGGVMPPATWQSGKVPPALMYRMRLRCSSSVKASAY